MSDDEHWIPRPVPNPAVMICAGHEKTGVNAGFPCLVLKFRGGPYEVCSVCGQNWHLYMATIPQTSAAGAMAMSNLRLASELWALKGHTAWDDDWENNV